MQAFVDMANGKRKLTVNVGYNFIDVRDLCDAAISAVENGRTGQITSLVETITCISGIGEIMEKN